MDYATPLSKETLRKLIRTRKKEKTVEELTGLSRRTMALLEQTPEFEAAETVMAYYALKDEVYTQDFLQKWVGKKRFLLPVVEGEDLRLKEYRPENEMRTGLLNVMEPDTMDYFTDYDQIDLVIVPGVAFDKQGNRMGRGKGFYDRFLPKLQRAKKTGVCYPFQLVEEVPHTDLDIRMDRVISC